VIFLSIASGLILALALPKPGMWAAAWVGLVPLFVALRGVGAWRGALCGFVAGVVYYGIILRWLMIFGALPWAAADIYQALYFAVFAALFTRLTPTRIGWLGFIAVPAAWVAVQFLRSLGPFGFAWGSFAHTQANCLPIIQVASIAGPWGIDFVVCFVSLALCTALTKYERSLTPLIVAASLVLGMVTFGLVSLRPPASSANGCRVAVLQGNMANDFHPIPHYLRRTYDRYAQMTMQAAKTHPEIILWPETALPMNVCSPGIADDFSKLARLSHSLLLIGGYDPFDNFVLKGSYNSLFAFNKDGDKAGCYHKAHLVPFGEFVPLREQLPFLKDYWIRSEDVLASDNHVLLDSPIGKIGVNICFESAFSQIALTETRDGAQVLCVVSNDAWFKRTSATQHLVMMARLRAVENRRFVMRAASTGISAVIDPYGRVRHELGMFRAGIIIDKIVPSQRLSLYTRFGDWFALLCIAITIFCLLGAQSSAWRKKRHRET